MKKKIRYKRASDNFCMCNFGHHCIDGTADVGQYIFCVLSRYIVLYLDCNVN